MISCSSHDEEHTAAAAHQLASVLEPGDVIAFSGPVGAGKTTFVRHLALALGVTEPVRSPTYTVGHLYQLSDGRTLAHLDLYRTQDVDASSWGDIEPYFASTWCAVEWPAIAEAWLEGTVTWRVEIDLLGEHNRVIRINGNPARMILLADRVVGITQPASSSVATP